MILFENNQFESFDTKPMFKPVVQKEERPTLYLNKKGLHHKKAFDQIKIQDQ